VAPISNAPRDYSSENWIVKTNFISHLKIEMGRLLDELS